MLFIEDDGAAYGIEHLPGLRQVIRSCMFAWSERGHAFFDEARGIRHCPDDGNGFVDNAFHESGRHAGGDGNHDVIRREVIRNLAQNFFDRLWLDAQKHEVRFPDRFGIR